MTRGRGGGEGVATPLPRGWVTGVECGVRLPVAGRRERSGIPAVGAPLAKARADARVDSERLRRKGGAGIARRAAEDADTAPVEDDLAGALAHSRPGSPQARRLAPRP